MPDDGRKDWSASFTEELAEIHGPRPGEAAADERPLVGLAISGGGIRSATFGLGVLQALKQHGRLARFDYLSTVSGGGYIGGWLSANCVRHPTWLHPDTSWKSSIDHLRRYSNYLSPKVGFFSADTWSMASIWLRNALLIQATVALAIAAVLLAPRPLVELFQQWSAAGNLRWITIALYLTGVVGVAGNLLRITTGGAVALLRARLWPAGLAGAAVLLLAAWVYARATGFDPFRTGEVDYASAAPVAVLLTVAAFLLQPVVVQLVRLFWLGKGAAPEQVNYTQGWAQAVVVIPLMAAAYLMAAVLWGEARGEAGAAGAGQHRELRRLRHLGLALLAVPALGRVRVAVAAVVLLGAQPARLAQSRGGHRGAARRGARVPPAAQRDHGAAARLDRPSVGCAPCVRLGAVAGRRWPTS